MRQRLDAPESEVSGREDRGWTQISKEVIYIFLGARRLAHARCYHQAPNGEAVGANYAVLQKLTWIKELNIAPGSTTLWSGRPYSYKDSARLLTASCFSFDTYTSAGNLIHLQRAIDKPQQTGEILDPGRDIVPFSFARCTLLGVENTSGDGKKFKRRLSGRSLNSASMFGPPPLVLLRRRQDRRIPIRSVLLKEGCGSPLRPRTAASLATSTEVSRLSTWT